MAAGSLPLVAYSNPSPWGRSCWRVCRRPQWFSESGARDWSWVIAGLFVLCFGPDVLGDPVNAWRVAGFLPVLWAFGTNYVPEKGAFSVVSARVPA